jgi:hypothetical protein
MPLTPARHMLWQCLEDAKMRRTVRTLQKYIESFRADQLATTEELAELEQTGSKILNLIYGERQP